MSISLSALSKQYGDMPVLRDINLNVESGELVALLGPSGSGKTTLLRIIAGMEAPDSGTVSLREEDGSERKAGKRPVGFVFQHYALFRHMNVFDNVSFGLRMRPRKERPSRGEIEKRVMKLLQLVHLEHYRDRYPSQLSGGQRQRVALARALAVEPKLLLLDEPFGALDAKVRKELRLWMRRLHDELHVTSIFVTHDQEEAMEVADRVVVMSQGRIEQIGTPGEIYHTPANSFVYDFMGNYNVFKGWRDAEGKTHLLDYENQTHEQALPVPKRTGLVKNIHRLGNAFRFFISGVASNTPPSSLPFTRKTAAPQPHEKTVKLFARPHELFITKTPDEEEYIRARILHINPAGPLVKVEMERPNGQILTAEVPKSVVDSLELARQETVFVRPITTRIFEK